MNGDLPSGFVLDEQPRPAKRRRGRDAAPPPPGNFVLDEAPEGDAAIAARPLRLTGEAHDGDTVRLTTGQNGRVLGVDAFELGQSGRLPDGSTQPLGTMGRNFLATNISPEVPVASTGRSTYGRPVVTLGGGGADPARGSVEAGLSVPRPNYLSGDPARRSSYVTAQREAIAAERGAYAGTYQDPTDYRQHGAAARWRGKIPMTPEQRDAYAQLVRNPKTTPDMLANWSEAQGHPITNAGNILAFHRKHKNAGVSDYFQQSDAQGDAVLRDGPGFITRQFGALNEGIADVAGFPVDVVNGGLGMLGVPVSERPILGSEWIRDQMHGIGVGQADESYAPRSDAERYTQAASRGTGQAIVPFGATAGAGGRLIMRAPSVITKTSPVRTAVRDLLTETARRPGVAAAAELGGGVGSGVGGQVADDVAPGNPWAMLFGQLIGGLGGGVAGGMSAARAGRSGHAEGLPPSRNAADRMPATGRDFAHIDEDGALNFNVTDEAGNDIEHVVRGTVDPNLDAQPLAAPSTPIPPSAQPRPAPAPAAPGEMRAVDTADLLDTVRRTLVEQNEPDWARMVAEGRAADRPDLIDAHGRLTAAVDELRLRGVDDAQIAADIRSAAGRRGWTRQQFDEIMAPRLSNLADIGPQREAVSVAGDTAPVGTLPRAGVAPANIGQDGRVYVGRQGGSHFEVAESYPDVQFGGGTGFVNPRGQYLDREQALDWVNANGENIRPADNMPGQLDALDYRDQRRANMAAEGLDDMSISAPVREVDRIDVGRGPAPPSGFVLDPPLSRRAGRMDERPSVEDLSAMAGRVDPGDVTPIPSNAVESMDEAAAIGEGMRPPVQGGDERKLLETRWLPSPRDPSRTLPRKGPLDLVSWLRTNGGLKPQGGELAHYGIDNAPRSLDFAQVENRLGKLVDPDRGMNYDEAALRAWEAGYFPDHVERPTINEFLETLQGTHSGRNRAFRSEDLAEVDAFEAARHQRHAVEQAANDEHPLVNDLGQSIDEADLIANTPPATAYEDLPRIGGRIGNIDMSKLDTRHDIRRVLQTTENRVGGFDAARRGRISQAETEALASELGMTADDLLKRRKGQALNAEEALAARQLLAKSSDDLIALAQKVDGGSDAELAAFRSAWLRHAAIQEQVTGATSEAGRALAQFKMAARSNAVKGRVHAAIVEGSGGRDRLEDAAKAILDLQSRGVSPDKVNRFAVDALKPKWSDKLVELWYNSILSGPQTHAVNILSNSMTAALQLPEMALASAIGGVRRAANIGSADRVVAKELGARAYGLLSGAREGLRAFSRTLRTGDVPDFVTKVEARTQKAISGKKGEVIRFPTRALAAEDELFKAIARNMEIRGLAVRKATFEGLKGDALKARTAELIANPDDKMVDMSLDYARYLTYQRPLGPAGQSVSRFTQSMPITKLFLPFIRTPANIFKFVAERSPAAPFVKEWRADIKAGGARRDLAAAKVVLGTGLGIVVAELARQGHITGSGPMDDGAETFMRADGWQPYSVRIGDKYYSYQRLDPLASTLGVAADLATKGSAMTEKQTQEATTLLVASIMKNLSDKTWLSGLSDLVEALEDPERNANRVVGRLAGSMAVPAVVGQTTRWLDPTLRETRSPMDFIKARVPGLSDDLPAKRDVWGREIVREGGVGPDFMSPIWKDTAENDRLNSEMLSNGVRIGAPTRDVAGRRLSDEEFATYRMLSGTLMEAAMRNLIDSPDWALASRSDRQDMADDVKKGARKQAREQLFGGQRKAPASPGLVMPDDVSRRLFPAPKGAPPPPTGFVLDQ